jgi:uncharacterized protein (TIGR02266 family)
VEAAFRVTYPDVDKLVVAYTQDLSNGGMFLRTQRLLPINAVIRLHIQLPGDGGELSVIARVVYVRDQSEAGQSGRKAGMGIQFLDMSQAHLDAIERFITLHTTATPETPPPAPARRAIHVLVVDDDDHYRECAARPFRERSDTVSTAVDGLEGLSACLKTRPDIVLSDVQMPRMDGWTLLRMIRARPSLATIPVVFLTTLGGEDERLRGYRLGVDDYVSKPYSPEELVVRVDRVMSRAVPGQGTPVDRKTLRGDVEQVSLASVLSFLELERRTGVLLVVGSERTGRIYIRDGRPLTVEVTDPPSGASVRDLALDLVGWTGGQFEFAVQDVSHVDELRTSIQGLLLEHARLADEATR